jgi:hypothetical protein
MDGRRAHVDAFHTCAAEPLATGLQILEALSRRRLSRGSPLEV